MRRCVSAVAYGILLVQLSLGPGLIHAQSTESEKAPLSYKLPEVLITSHVPALADEIWTFDVLDQSWRSVLTVLGSPSHLLSMSLPVRTRLFKNVQSWLTDPDRLHERKQRTQAAEYYALVTLAQRLGRHLIVAHYLSSFQDNDRRLSAIAAQMLQSMPEVLGGADRLRVHGHRMLADKFKELEQSADILNNLQNEDHPVVKFQVLQSLGRKTVQVNAQTRLEAAAKAFQVIPELERNFRQHARQAARKSTALAIRTFSKRYPLHAFNHRTACRTFECSAPEDALIEEASRGFDDLLKHPEGSALELGEVNAQDVLFLEYKLMAMERALQNTIGKLLRADGQETQPVQRAYLKYMTAYRSVQAMEGMQFPEMVDFIGLPKTFEDMRTETDLHHVRLMPHADPWRPDMDLGFQIPGLRQALERGKDAYRDHLMTFLDEADALKTHQWLDFAPIVADVLHKDIQMVLLLKPLSEKLSTEKHRSAVIESVLQKAGFMLLIASCFFGVGAVFFSLEMAVGLAAVAKVGAGFVLVDAMYMVPAALSTKAHVQLLRGLVAIGRSSLLDRLTLLYAVQRLDHLVLRASTSSVFVGLNIGLYMRLGQWIFQSYARLREAQNAKFFLDGIQRLEMLSAKYGEKLGRLSFYQNLSNKERTYVLAVLSSTHDDAWLTAETALTQVDDVAEAAILSVIRKQIRRITVRPHGSGGVGVNHTDELTSLFQKLSPRHGGDPLPVTPAPRPVPTGGIPVRPGGAPVPSPAAPPIASRQPLNAPVSAVEPQARNHQGVTHQAAPASSTEFLNQLPAAATLMDLNPLEDAMESLLGFNQEELQEFERGLDDGILKRRSDIDRLWRKFRQGDQTIEAEYIAFLRWVLENGNAFERAWAARLLKAIFGEGQPNPYVPVYEIVGFSEMTRAQRLGRVASEIFWDHYLNGGAYGSTPLVPDANDLPDGITPEMLSPHVTRIQYGRFIHRILALFSPNQANGFEEHGSVRLPGYKRLFHEALQVYVGYITALEQTLAQDAVQELNHLTPPEVVSTLFSAGYIPEELGLSFGEAQRELNDLSSDNLPNWAEKAALLIQMGVPEDLYWGKKRAATVLAKTAFDEVTHLNKVFSLAARLNVESIYDGASNEPFTDAAPLLFTQGRWTSEDMGAFVREWIKLAQANDQSWEEELLRSSLVAWAKVPVHGLSDPMKLMAGVKVALREIEEFRQDPNVFVGPLIDLLGTASQFGVDAEVLASSVLTGLDGAWKRPFQGNEDLNACKLSLDALKFWIAQIGRHPEVAKVLFNHVYPNVFQSKYATQFKSFDQVYQHAKQTFFRLFRALDKATDAYPEGLHAYAELSLVPILATEGVRSLAKFKDLQKVITSLEDQLRPYWREAGGLNLSDMQMEVPTESVLLVTLMEALAFDGQDVSKVSSFVSRVARKRTGLVSTFDAIGKVIQTDARLKGIFSHALRHQSGKLFDLFDLMLLFKSLKLNIPDAILNQLMILDHMEPKAVYDALSGNTLEESQAHRLFLSLGGSPASQALTAFQRAAQRARPRSDLRSFENRWSTQQYQTSLASASEKLGRVILPWFEHALKQTIMDRLSQTYETSMDLEGLSSSFSLALVIARQSPWNRPWADAIIENYLQGKTFRHGSGQDPLTMYPYTLPTNQAFMKDVFGSAEKIEHFYAPNPWTYRIHPKSREGFRQKQIRHHFRIASDGIQAFNRRIAEKPFLQGPAIGDVVSMPNTVDELMALQPSFAESARSIVDQTQFQRVQDILMQLRSIERLQSAQRPSREITSITIRHELDPINVMMLGNWVEGSCLRFGSMVENYFAVIADATDANKPTYYAYDQDGNFIARVRAYIDVEGQLRRFPTYYAPGVEYLLDDYFNHYLVSTAQRSGLPAVGRMADDPWDMEDIDHEGIAEGDRTTAYGFLNVPHMYFDPADEFDYDSDVVGQPKPASDLP